MRDLPSEYASLVYELHRLAAANNEPVSGVFELTERCNLNCRMCYVRQPAGDEIRRAEELASKEWLELAREAVDNGMLFLLVTGGEPLLRRDFFDFYMPLTRLGLVITLFTNGTCITEKIARRLAEAPPSRTAVTLYGATATTYEAVTGIRGSYARCCYGIETLIRHGIPLGLKATVTQQNVAELEAMRKMAKNWGVPFAPGWLISRRRDGAPNDVDECRLSALDCVDLELNAHSCKDAMTQMAASQVSLVSDQNFFCDAGKSSFFVSSNGEMNACIDLPQPRVRPLDVGFSSAWRQVQQFVENSSRLSSTCLECEARGWCSRCPAWSLLETNTLTEPVPYLCEIARARRHKASSSV